METSYFHVSLLTFVAALIRFFTETPITKKYSVIMYGALKVLKSVEFEHFSPYVINSSTLRFERYLITCIKGLHRFSYLPLTSCSRSGAKLGMRLILRILLLGAGTFHRQTFRRQTFR